MRSVVGDARLGARRRLRRARDHVRARLDADARRSSCSSRRRRRGWCSRRFRRWPDAPSGPAARVGVLLGRDRRACSSGSRRRPCRATGCSISRGRGSSSSSTTSRSTGSPSSPTAACIPGYAFPLWHGFLALIAKLAGEDPERVVTHLPSILAPLAVLVAFEAGWALFRRTWAAGRDRGRAGRDDRLRAGNGRRVRLPLAPGDVVAPAPRAGRARAGARVGALAVARARRLDRGRGLRARGRAPDLRDLPLDPVRRLPRRARAVGAEGPPRRARSRSARSSSPPRSSCSGCARS